MLCVCFVKLCPVFVRNGGILLLDLMPFFETHCVTLQPRETQSLRSLYFTLALAFGTPKTCYTTCIEQQASIKQNPFPKSLVT